MFILNELSCYTPNKKYMPNKFKVPGWKSGA